MFFKKMGYSWPLFIYFRLFNAVDNKCSKYELDSNLRLLEMEATTLPTEPQPLHIVDC